LATDNLPSSTTFIKNIASPQNVEDVLHFDPSAEYLTSDQREVLRQKESLSCRRLITLAMYTKTPTLSLFSILQVYHDANLPLRPDYPLSTTENIRTAFTSMADAQSPFLAPKLIGKLYHEDIGHLSIPVVCDMDTVSKLGTGSGGRIYEARICKDHFHFNGVAQTTGL
jgi:hypothetical protein